jgi:PadR family transcriptional regulator PadR
MPESGRVDDRYLYAGLIRLHVLHHAVKEPVYGLAMIEELARHGYKGSAARRVYRATPAGEAALTAAKQKVRELFGELFEDDSGRDT